MVIGLCQTFHCTPSQLDKESAEILRLVTIRQEGTKEDQEPDYGEPEV